MRTTDTFGIECSTCSCAVEVPVGDVSNGVLTCPRCGASHVINWPAELEAVDA